MTRPVVKAGIFALQGGQQQRRRILRIAWLLLLASVVAGSLLPRDSAVKHAMDAVDPGGTLWHLLAYFLLALLPALHETRPVVALQVVATLSIGVMLEFAQERFTNRSFGASDLAANAAGVLAALMAAPWVRRRLAVVPLWSQTGEPLLPSATDEGR